MKNQNRTKEKITKYLTYLFPIVIGLSLVVSTSLYLKKDDSNSSIEAATKSEQIDELNNIIKSKENEIASIKSKQKEYQKQIDAKQSEILSLKEQLELYDIEIKNVQQKILLKETEITNANLKIENISKDIDVKEEQIATDKKSIGQLLRTIHTTDDANYFEIFVSNESISDYFNKLKFYTDIQDSMKNKLVSFKEAKASLDIQKTSVEKQKTDLVALNNALKAEKSDLTTKSNSKTALIAQTQNSEKKYESLLSSMIAEEQKIAKQVIPLLQDQIAELSKTEAQTMFESPLHTSTRINSPFGWRTHPITGVSTFHYGLDLRASQGTSLYAAAAGQVIEVRPSCGYYTWITIQHTGSQYLTRYFHMSSIGVSNGQKVDKGQYIGKVGGTPGLCGGYGSTGAHLHFEIRDISGCSSSCSGKSINPLEFIEF